MCKYVLEHCCYLLEHNFCPYIIIVALILSIHADVAEWMMDRSIRTVDPEEEGGEELTEDSCEIEYSFQFLEDFQDETPMLPFSNFFKRSDILPRYIIMVWG